MVQQIWVLAAKPANLSLINRPTEKKEGNKSFRLCFDLHVFIGACSYMYMCADTQRINKCNKNS